MALHQCIHLRGDGDQKTGKIFSSAVHGQSGSYMAILWMLIYAAHHKEVPSINYLLAVTASGIYILKCSNSDVLLM